MHNYRRSQHPPMKMPASPSSALLLILCVTLPVSAQLIEVPSANLITNGNKVEGLDSAENPSFASNKALSGVYQLPTVQKASGDLSEGNPVYVNQDVLTLSERSSAIRKVENVLDLSVLREPSAYRNANRVKLKVSDAQASGIHAGLAEISAAYQKPGEMVDSVSCSSVAMSVSHRIQIDPSTVLEVVESEVSANANCACEIVKTAIKASGADPALVADIAEVAITSAPENMRIISQCAIAAMPEALAEVQAVLARLDSNRGYSSYSGKDAKAAIASAVEPPTEPRNPLDTPPPFFPRIAPPPYSPPPSSPPPELLSNPNPVP